MGSAPHPYHHQPDKNLREHKADQQFRKAEDVPAHFAAFLLNAAEHAAEDGEGDETERREEREGIDGRGIHRWRRRSAITCTEDWKMRDGELRRVKVRQVVKSAGLNFRQQRASEIDLDFRRVRVAFAEE